MLDLGMLERRLNQDALLRARFIADQVGFLRARGLILSLDQARALRQVVAQSKTDRPGVAGGSIAPLRLQLTTKLFFT